MLARPSICSGPIRRRGFMEIGALSLAGLGLPQFLQAKARGAVSRDTNVIFIWLPGGPPHMEMYDLKPDAPSEYRGIFRPIRTNVPGMEVGELLPRHAKCADKFNLIRSCHHEFADHGGGHKRFMTGRLPAAPTGFVNDAPAVTSVVVDRLEGLNAEGLPNVIVGTDTGRQGIDTFSLGASWLGQSRTPFVFHGDPSAADFAVQNLSLDAALADRLDDRLTLLQGFDRLRRGLDHGGSMEAMDSFHQEAVTMLTSPAVRKAFDSFPGTATHSGTLRDDPLWAARIARSPFGGGRVSLCHHGLGAAAQGDAQELHLQLGFSCGEL